MTTLITGGVKSGKSRYAVDLAHSEFKNLNFLATAVAFDDEMQDKIHRHQHERQGQFHTVEEPVNIDTAVQNDMIIDCIPMWISNMIYYKREHQIETILDNLTANLPPSLIIVTNETGLGNIPFDAETRHYNSLLGVTNQRLARAVDRVILMVSGYPIIVKPQVAF